MKVRLRWLLPALLLAGAGCQREAPAPQAQGGDVRGGPAQTVAPVPAAEPTPVALEDVIERDPRYLVGISYPPGINRYPGLAAELQRYTDAARSELMQALDEVDAGDQAGPYDLSLGYSIITDTPQIIAVAANGSSYTGGAHGAPLVARFVWLPQRDQLLTVNRLIGDPRGWTAISRHVREQLRAAMSQRIDADELAPGDRAELMRSALQMIDEGSEPDAANFEQFEPVMGARGRLIALRFVFPPYQVGPYSDGVQAVEVPASVLLPYVAPQYRDLFADP